MTRAPAHDVPDLGAEGEIYALGRLRKEGYRVLETNFRTRGGEIDVVALERGTLCFVEVKTRASCAAGTPEEAVDARKIRRIVKAATTYRTLHSAWNMRVRFDVVAVRVGGKGEYSAEITRGAFFEDGWS